MIFIYGTRAKTIATRQLDHVVCKHCGEPQSIYGNVVSRHVHFFRIPLFPLGKEGYSLCTHCKQTLDEERMPVNYREAIHRLKSDSKLPVWQFTGLLLLGTGIITFILLVLIAGISGH